MTAIEANFDGLVGPTHNYSGLSYGNVASRLSSGAPSNPQEAALQGLAKMKTLADMGLRQGVLPPHDRPHIGALRRLGYEGDDAVILDQVNRTDPQLLAAVSSASAMWAANAATVSPSPDTGDGRVHFTPANLVSNPHRRLEAETTRLALATIFDDQDRFAIHDPLPSTLSDEGAANHTRLSHQHGSPGVELFVYGAGGRSGPTRYPGRQSVLASRTIAGRHGVRTKVMAQQQPAAIDAGVFHNDVISVGNLTTLFLHELAFVDQAAVLAALAELLEGQLDVVEVPNDRISVHDAVSTYLFNSQLLTIRDRQVLLAPAEVGEHQATAALVDDLVNGDSPIDEVVMLDLHQSMRNGGGPACLRLRIVLTPEEEAAVLPSIWLTDERYQELVGWVMHHYRTELRPGDLADPQLLDETRRALDELTRLLELGSLYEFQR